MLRQVFLSLAVLSGLVLSTPMVVGAVSGFADPAPSAELLVKAKQLYYSGISGNAADLSQSAELFETLSEGRNEPLSNQALINAYRGSLLLMEAGRSLAIWKKSALSKRGLSLLDDSVSADPTNLEVRFVRAATTLHLPGFFKRHEQSCEDFRYIAPRAAEAAGKQNLDVRLAAGALFMYAKSCAIDSVLSSDEAMRQAAKVAPHSPAGEAAGSELASRHAATHP